MSFGGQSNTWQRGMMQSQPQTKSFQKDPPQMFMQTKQQNKMPNCGNGGMYPNFVSGGNLYYTQPRSGLNPAEFQGIGDEIDRSTGIITNIKNDCGLINNEVFFYGNEFKGQDLKLGDRVRFDASLSTSGKFKWNATRIRLMPPNSKEVMDSTKSNYSGNIQMVQRHISPNRISPVLGGGGSVRYERDRYEKERDSRHHSRDRDEEERDRRRRREERERSRERINTTSSVRPTSRAPDRERERERVRESSRERIYSERNRMLERNDKYKEHERLDTELFRRRDPALIANALPHKFDDVQEMSNRHTTPSTMSYFPTNSTKPEGYRNPSMMQQCGTFKSQMTSNLVEAHASSTGNAVQRQSTAKPVTSVHLCALDPDERQKIADRKRQRSSESTPPEATSRKRQREGTVKDKPMAKKVDKPLTNPSFKDALVGQKVAILAKDFPNTVLSTAQMDEIQNSIMDKVLEEEVIKPQFLNSTYKAGYLTLHCKNDATVEWMKKLAPDLKPWATADLWAMEETKVPHPKIVVGYFPNAATVETERILSFVQRQNDGLRVEAWRMLRRANKKTSAMLVFSMDQISAAKLEETKGRISFKFGQVQLHLKEAGGKDVEEEETNDAASSSTTESPK